AQMDQGHGGLFAHALGDSVSSDRSSVYWLTRPRGIQWQPPLDAVRARCPEGARNSPSRCRTTPRSRCRQDGRRGGSSDGVYPALRTDDEQGLLTQAGAAAQTLLAFLAAT